MQFQIYRWYLGIVYCFSLMPLLILPPHNLSGRFKKPLFSHPPRQRLRRKATLWL